MKNRIVEIDIIRGFIILLVFTGNIEIFSGVTEPTNAAELFIVWLIHVFIDGSIYTCFAFLFGVGFALQSGDGSYWIRRMGILCCIGIVHAVLINHADILVVYSLFGLLLYLARDCSNRDIIIIAVLLMLIPFAANLSYWLAGVPLERAGAVFDVRFTQLSTVFAARLDRWLTGYLPGQLIITFPNILGSMMLGYVAGRVGVDRWNLLAFRLAGFWGLLSMLIYGTLYTLVDYGTAIPFANAIATIGAPLLALGYMAAIIQMHRETNVMQKIFAPSGRMSLSLYIMSGLIGNIFYLGLYGRVSIVLQVGIIAVVYLFQMAFAYLWMRTHKQGLIEALWRKLAMKSKSPC